MTAVVIVFGFVVLMVVLGQNLIAATAAAGATAMAAANLARQLTVGGVDDRKQSAELEDTESETADASQGTADY